MFWLDEGERKKYQRSLSLPNSPVSGPTPVTPTTLTARKENVWRSVFHPGSNLATKSIGSDVFDKPQPNSPTVYDWCVYLVSCMHGFCLAATSLATCNQTEAQRQSMKENLAICLVAAWK
ncbi:hypothetical protein Gogos_008161 [Gossypium gossypioides]|uniref:Uncharacterized protein n=1 Tax=Gossypium gossypioides TaxID=34282 RepID=A0A7J9CAP1_GOSGO|nr:hypothetical protein [Gossypium gossypioides]